MRDHLSMYEELCPHLAPHVSLDGSTGPRVVAGDFWAGAEWELHLSAEPVTAATASPPLRPRVMGAGARPYTHAYDCPEHHQRVTWRAAADAVSEDFREAVERDRQRYPSVWRSLLGLRAGRGRGGPHPR